MTVPTIRGPERGAAELGDAGCTAGAAGAGPRLQARPVVTRATAAVMSVRAGKGMVMLVRACETRAIRDASRFRTAEPKSQDHARSFCTSRTSYAGLLQETPARCARIDGASQARNVQPARGLRDE